MLYTLLYEERELDIDELIQEERLDEIYKYVEAKKKIKILTK